MKYLRILIFVLLLVLVGIAGYYLYLVLNTGKSVKTVNTETETPFDITQNTVNPASPNVVSKFNDYTSADSAVSGNTINIQGSIMAVDSVKKTINDILYSYVLGILDDNGNLSSVWLTEGEYEGIRADIPDHGIPGTPVIITLSQNGVSFKVNLPQ